MVASVHTIRTLAFSAEYLPKKLLRITAGMTTDTMREAMSLLPLSLNRPLRNIQYPTPIIQNIITVCCTTIPMLFNFSLPPCY